MILPVSSDRLLIACGGGTTRSVILAAMRMARGGRRHGWWDRFVLAEAAVVAGPQESDFSTRQLRRARVES